MTRRPSEMDDDELMAGWPEALKRDYTAARSDIQNQLTKRIWHGDEAEAEYPDPISLLALRKLLTGADVTTTEIEPGVFEHKITAKE